MTGPRRLLEQPGCAARLLQAADTHVPSERARRVALLAAGSAATTLAASGSAAATGGGALLKSVFVWLGAGALGGAAITVAATSTLRPPSPPAAESAPIAVVAPRAQVSVDTAPTTTVASPMSKQADPTPAPSDPARSPTPSARAPKPQDSSADAARAANAAPAGQIANAERTTPDLYAQLHVIDDARSAAARRDTGAVLAILDNYDRTYPRGQFVPESLALRIETVARAGDGARARALAAQFRREYPRHPLSARVAAALGD